jgi:aryl-alcohol dehydrogenase-like predicted oxidoreductase
MHTRTLGQGLTVSAVGLGCMGAHAVQAVTAVQSEYPLWTRDPEAEVLPTLALVGHNTGLAGSPAPRIR